MSTLEDDWRAALDEVDAELIDEFQSGVPVEQRPFRAIGAALGVSEQEALSRVEHLRDQGILRRFGAVLNPPVIGSSTLAAVQAPEERLDEISSIVNSYQQVNHNYRRDHAWNMWFVVTAGSRETRDRILREIETRSGCEVLNLPMLTDYYIDLEFPVVNTDRFARESLGETAVDATRISENATADLSPLDRRILLEIQDGLPLSSTPYRDVADAIGASCENVVTAIGQLLRDGCIKRIGCVVNHVVTGFDSNCMVVWDVPDEALDTHGERVGSLPYVTLCYHRPSRPKQNWPYTLFTMIHGRNTDAVDEMIDELASEHLSYPHERLYSTETLKQTGARYEDFIAVDE
jgi:DNA-binding Lrp family transcriptional regulator